MTDLIPLIGKPVSGFVASAYGPDEDAAAFRVCVTGGRDETDLGYVWSLLDVLHGMPKEIGGRGPITQLGAGCARGVDELALAWAQANRVPWIKYVADWDRYGPPAGCLRNGVMLEHFKPDVLCVYDGGVGTADCTRQARKLGIEREIYSKRSDDPFEDAATWG